MLFRYLLDVDVDVAEDLERLLEYLLKRKLKEGTVELLLVERDVKEREGLGTLLFDVETEEKSLLILRELLFDFLLNEILASKGEGVKLILGLGGRKGVLLLEIALGSDVPIVVLKLDSIAEGESIFS